MIYRSCTMIEGNYLNINGRIDTGEKVIALCCEGIDDIPGIPFAETPEATLRNFFGERNLLIAESKGAGRLSGRFCSGCEKCANYRSAEWSSDGLIHYVNLSMYPSPCQCRCIYCGVHKENQSVMSETAKAAYTQLFALLDAARKSGLIANDAIWQVSCGEIAIHPYREQIMELVRGKKAVFYTNCIKYDEDIARNLHDNPQSAINLSIDAGTPDTWKKVKGFDNFESVTSNLAKYYAESARAGQITLKYIILPDINDTYADYLSLMEIMKVLEVKHLSLSRDTRDKYKIGAKQRTKLASAAAYLMAICHKSGITCGMFTYTPAEQKEVIKLANEILRKGLI